jgi:glutathione synthase/RimK-type ligase-like ATP-grasp enzyme
MRNLQGFRAGKPAFYPDHAIYAAYACAEFGLSFEDLDGGTGLVFRVTSPNRSIHFGAGRCCWYPQNNSTAATLASDKFFANRILEDAGVTTLGGDYFFLSERHRAHRPEGHERDDACVYFRKLGSAAFIKPLAGSRGDFAQAIRSEAALDRYLLEVSRHYDAVLMQPIATGKEYRVFLLDGEIVFCVRKFPPFLVGDGLRTRRELLSAHNAALQTRGLSGLAATALDEPALDAIAAAGERWEIPGRMNLSAGGTMVFEAPRSGKAIAMARNAARALGLRVAAVDLFTDADGDPDAIRIIEVNSNPSIRFLEQSDRSDLILKIWRHTFSSMGLLDAGLLDV